MWRMAWQPKPQLGSPTAELPNSPCSQGPMPSSTLQNATRRRAMALPASVLLSVPGMLLCTQKVCEQRAGPQSRNRRKNAEAALEPKAQLCRPAARLQRRTRTSRLSKGASLGAAHIP